MRTAWGKLSRLLSPVPLPGKCCLHRHQVEERSSIQPDNWPTVVPSSTSCGCSNAPSLGRCSNTSPNQPASTTTATCDPPGKPKTSASPSSPTTSASGPTTSPDSNVDSNATTPSPPAIETGSQQSLDF